MQRILIEYKTEFMSKVKYKYNPETLTYEKHEFSWNDRLKSTGKYVTVGIVFSFATVMIWISFFDSPKEKILKRENAYLIGQLENFNKKMDQMDVVLNNIQDRDNNVYRSIFEAEVIPNSVRTAGFGGVNRYDSLRGYNSSEVVTETATRLDILAKQMYHQSKSLDDVYEMAKNKTKMLASIPAIQPVNNKDLKRMASGFGMRYHPILKVRKMHTGMDFTARTGTEIYATGDGVVEKVLNKRGGYGKHVIVNHGYGYKTLYAHMSKFNVRRGQKIKRGDLIGFVGNTGRSTGPHLHYEVIKDGKHMNPAYYYTNDLTPEEYELMIELSSQSNQSFD